MKAWEIQDGQYRLLDLAQECPVEQEGTRGQSAPGQSKPEQGEANE